MDWLVWPVKVDRSKGCPKYLSQMKSKWSSPFDFQLKFLEIVLQWKLLTGLLKGGFPVIGYSYNVLAVGPKICWVHSGYNTAMINRNCDSLLGCVLSCCSVQNWLTCTCIVFCHFVFLQLKLAELASIADDVIKLEKKVGMCHKK